MFARRIARIVLLVSLLACPLAARGGAFVDLDPSSLEVTGPRAAEPTRLFVATLTPDKSSDPASLFDGSLRDDAFSLGLAPGPIPAARVLDPLPEASILAMRDPVTASLEAVSRHAALTALASDELELVATRETPKINVVHFRQMLDGLSVLGSKITMGWDRAGRLRLAGSTVFLPGPLENGRRKGLPAQPSSWVSEQAARQAALAAFPGSTRATGWETIERAWLPLQSEEPASAAPTPDGRSLNAGSSRPPRFVPVWSLRFRTVEPDGWWEAIVHGESEELLARRNLITDLAQGRDPGDGAEAADGSTVSGRVRGWIEPTTAGDPLEERPFPYAALELHSTTSTLRGESDREGHYALEAVGPGEYTLRASLTGRYIRVVEESREGLTPVQNRAVAAPQEVDLVWADPVPPEARDAYVHANLAHDVVRARDDGPALDPLDRPVDLVINAPIGQVSRCNAWWDGEAFWFHRASTWCPSFARIASIVYHEYSHAVIRLLCGGFTPPDYLAEGWSDYFAATIADDPRIGLGFMGPNTVLRDVAYNRVWPDDASWEPHFQGLIIASTLWDLREILGPSQTDSLFHFAIYGGAQTHEEYLLDMLAWDDDDGDIGNGTPHFEEILSTFRAHGIADDGIYLAFDPIDDPLEGPSTIELSLTIRSPLHAVDADSCALFARWEGEAGFTRYPVTRAGRTQTYRARIPQPEAGATVEYYWYGVNTFGRRGYLPSGAPEATFSFRVRQDLVAPSLEHEPSGAIAAGSGGPWLQVRARDNAGCISSVTSRFRVGSEGPTEEIELSSVGDGLYSGRLPLDALAAGDVVEYSLTAVDCAGRPNRTTYPSSGAVSLPVRVGTSFDFEADTGPLQPQGDWGWGRPFDPALAHSGTNAWGTAVLGGDDVVNSSDLIWGPIDLRGADRASLRVRQALRIESEHAAARVDVATSPVPNWRPLIPDGGYPALGPGDMGPCFERTTVGSEEVAFPLDHLLGRKVWFRFHYVNDGQDHGRGWFIDDLRLLQEQVRECPSSFSAASGQDRKVSLRWDPPAGADPAGWRFRGYRIYRTVSGAGFLTEPLVNLPAATTIYLDRGLQNGITYRYRLHAVYDEGESAGLERDATPNSGQLALESGALDLFLRDYAPLDTTARLRNAGRGELLYQLFLGLPAATLADVKVVHAISTAPETPWITVTPDPEDVTSGPDLAALDARQWSDSTGTMLEIRLRGRAAWGDATRSWGGAILLDTDLDLTTGVDRLGTWTARGGVGADWLVVFGTAATSLGLDGTKAWLLAGGATTGTPLAHADLTGLQDRVELSVPLAVLGGPTELQLLVLVGPDPQQPITDRIPDAPPDWLSRAPLRGRLDGGARGTFTLSVDGTGLPNGTYGASIVIDSNDPDTPWRRLPVHLRVDRDLPPDLGALSFRSVRAGIEGIFRLRAEVRPDSVDVERREGEEWRVLARRLTSDAEGRYRFLDRRAANEDSSAYRFLVVEGDRRHLYGPFVTRWSFTPPPIEAPQFVSTEEGIEGALRLSAAHGDVHAVRGERCAAEAEEWIPLALSAPDSTGWVRFFDRWTVRREDAVRPEARYLYRFQIDTATEDSLGYGPYECTFSPPVPAALVLHPPRPTPFRDQLVLRIDLPREEPVRLEVFDAGGRRRATIVQDRLPAGIHQIAWDGRDANGSTLPAGTYWLRLFTNEGSRVVRAVRFR